MVGRIYQIEVLIPAQLTKVNRVGKHLHLMIAPESREAFLDCRHPLGPVVALDQDHRIQAQLLEGRKIGQTLQGQAPWIQVLE